MYRVPPQRGAHHQEGPAAPQLLQGLERLYIHSVTIALDI